MRRSICYCEPSQALAGELNTWKFIYTGSNKLPKGTKLRFDLMSDGREIDWEIPTTNLKKASNLIYGLLENGKTLSAKEIEIPDSYFPLYEFELPKEIAPNEPVTIVVGSPKLDEKNIQKNGTTAQTYSQRRRTFLLYIDTSGKGHFDDPESFTLDIKGNALHHVRLLTPSYVTRNKRFDVIARFEDAHNNLTSMAPDDTLFELSYEQLRENLNWRLFVPETGFITVPNLYFNEEGIYTIEFKNCNTGDIFRSSPIKCFNENEKSLFWGLLHGESVRVDSTDNIENCLRHFRDEKAMSFYGTSSFESLEETPNDIWKLINQNVQEFDEGDRYTTFLGFQWVGTPKSEGVRQFIWSKDSKSILRKKDAKYSSLKKIYKSYAPKDLLSIPTFTMGKGYEFDFKDFNPEFERVVEIYNSWGSSECTKKQGNERPISGPAKKGVQEAPEGAVIEALKKNYRFGFVAGGLDDRGIYGDFWDTDQEQYSPGATAIISKDHTRAALFDALQNRSCYATTGERIIVGFYIIGEQMGTELDTAEKHGLLYNRYITGFVAGTTDIEKVEIIRNGDVIQTFKPDTYHFEYEYDDLTPLKDVVIDAKDKNPAFAFYYLKVTQVDGHIAWTSPIWVDYIPGKPIKKSKAASKIKKRVEEGFDDDDFDED